MYASAQRLFALRASNGKVRWGLAGGGSAWSAPAVGGNGTLYSGYNDSHVYALDAATGRTKWQFATDDGLICFPTVGSEGHGLLPVRGGQQGVRPELGERPAPVDGGPGPPAVGEPAGGYSGGRCGTGGK